MKFVPHVPCLCWSEPCEWHRDPVSGNVHSVRRDDVCSVRLRGKVATILPRRRDSIEPRAADAVRQASGLQAVSVGPARGRATIG